MAIGACHSWCFLCTVAYNFGWCCNLYETINETAILKSFSVFLTCEYNRVQPHRLQEKWLNQGTHAG
jgi:hypothetical protein